MVKKIILSSGRECLVDADDFAWVSETRWSDDSRGYAIRAKVNDDGTRTTEKMHRLIIGAKDGELVDHINGNPSDNRKANLRIVDDKTNARNTNIYNTNKSGYKGVAVHKNGKYTAQITVNYKKIHLGVFNCPKEGARAYNKAAKNYFGKYAKLNEITD